LFPCPWEQNKASPPFGAPQTVRGKKRGGEENSDANKKKKEGKKRPGGYQEKEKALPWKSRRG